MFGGTPVTSHSTSPLVGLAVQLQRTIDRPCECGGTAVIVGESKGPHVGVLYCASCQRHRGWLPKTVACFLSETVRVFGKSSSPIIVRESSNSGPCGPEFGCVPQLSLKPLWQRKENAMSDDFDDLYGSKYLGAADLQGRQKRVKNNRRRYRGSAREGRKHSAQIRSLFRRRG